MGRTSCHSKTNVSISINKPVNRELAHSLSPFTFFLGSGGGFTAIFGGLAILLTCSSLIAIIVDECTMVRWGVKPRCRQLRMYCKERRESAWMKQSQGGMRSWANQNCWSRNRWQEIMEKTQQQPKFHFNVLPLVFLNQHLPGLTLP